MGCSTCGGNRRVEPVDVVYVVTYPDGRTEEVNGIRQAKVKVLMNRGATYVAK